MVDEIDKGTKVIVERLYTGRETFGGQVPPHNPALEKKRREIDQMVNDASNVLRKIAWDHYEKSTYTK